LPLHFQPFPPRSLEGPGLTKEREQHGRDVGTKTVLAERAGAAGLEKPHAVAPGGDKIRAALSVAGQTPPTYRAALARMWDHQPLTNILHAPIELRFADPVVQIIFRVQHIEVFTSPLGSREEVAVFPFHRV
jgi:hypothetical protein